MFELTETEIPEVTVTRTAEPNPFDGKFPADDKALQIILPGKAEDVTKDVSKITRLARTAAGKVDRSARVHATPDGSGKTARVVVKVWTVAKITRPRAGAGESE